MVIHSSSDHVIVMVVNFYGYADVFPHCHISEQHFTFAGWLSEVGAAECDRELFGPPWGEIQTCVRSDEVDYKHTEFIGKTAEKPGFPST